MRTRYAVRAIGRGAMILKSAVVAAMLALASRAEAGLCEKYQVVVDGGDDVVAKQDVMRWAEYALKAEGHYSARVPCALWISIVALKVQNKGGVDMGWTIGLHISTRRAEDSGQTLIDREAQMVFTAGDVRDVRQTLRDDIEQFVSKMK
jgi:hypothetical protein